MKKYFCNHIKISLFVIVSLTFCNNVFGQNIEDYTLKEVMDSISLISYHNRNTNKEITNLNDSINRLDGNIKSLSDNINNLSSKESHLDKHLISLYFSGGSAPILYKPKYGSRSGGIGYLLGLKYSFYWNDNWGLRAGASFDKYKSQYSLNNHELSFSAIDSDEDEFFLLTNFNGLKDVQQSSMFGLSLESSYRTEIADDILLSINLGFKYSTLVKGESEIVAGNYTTKGHYPKYGQSTIIPEGPGFEKYRPKYQDEDDYVGAFSLIGGVDFIFKVNNSFAFRVGPTLDYQLNKNNIDVANNAPLVSYVVQEKQEATVVYNGLYKSDVLESYRNMFVGLTVGIDFDLGGIKAHSRHKKVNKLTNKSSQLQAERDGFYNEKLAQEEENVRHQEDLMRLKKLYDAIRAKEVADNLNKSLREAELALMEEEQRLLDSLEQAVSVGVIVDLRSSKLSEEDKLILKLPLVFEFGTSNLTQGSLDNLKKISQMLAKYDMLEFEITGHTCDIGSDQANYKVGMDRANSIKNDFVRNGISTSKIQTFSKGKLEPIVPNTSEENRRKNRRVVLVIDDK